MRYSPKKTNRACEQDVAAELLAGGWLPTTKAGHTWVDPATGEMIPAARAMQTVIDRNIRRWQLGEAIRQAHPVVYEEAR